MTDIVPQRLFSDNGSDITVSLQKHCAIRSGPSVSLSPATRLQKEIASPATRLDWVMLKEIAIVVV